MVWSGAIPSPKLQMAFCLRRKSSTYDSQKMWSRVVEKAGIWKNRENGGKERRLGDILVLPQNLLVTCALRVRIELAKD